MNLVGANSSAQARGVNELPGKSNYFIGNNPAQWRTNVPTYAKVKYEGVYPGVDLIYYGNQQKLEYDFIVAPGADPASIRLAIGGLKKSEGRGEKQKAEGRNQKSEGKKETQNSQLETRLHVDVTGDLIAQTSSGEVRFHKPVVYQEEAKKAEVRSQKSEGREENQASRNRYRGQLTSGLGQWATDNPKSEIQNREFLEGHYILEANGIVHFGIQNYDRTMPLIIDPVLTYSTYLGGNKDDIGNAIAVDGQGNAYVTGSTLSPIFPTANAFQGVCKGCASNNTSVFVTKFNPAGTAPVYSTFLGGTRADSASAIAVDAKGNVYLTGSALSTDFPTMNPFQAACASCSIGLPDAFVTELNAAGSALVYSTYLGGSRNDQGNGIAVDSNGSAYVTGTTLSDNFPTVTPLQNICQGCDSNASDAFVTKFDPTGATLLYSTFLGGSSIDQGLSVAVDSSFNAYVTGRTQSNNFPAVNSFQSALGGGQDAFITKIDPAGATVVYSTYVGGSGNEEGRSIALDSAGNAYLTGFTNSSNFPTQNPIQGALAGNQDAFVLELDRTGATLDYSTYLGGFNNDVGNGIAVDSLGNAYVTGSTSSFNFPAVNPFQAANAGRQDAFITKINSTGAAIIMSTYLGGHDVDAANGIAVDTLGNVYVTGQTFSNDFPTANPFQPTTGGNFDVFVAQLSGLTAPTATFSATSLSFPSQAVGTSSTTQSVTLTNNGDATLTITSIAITTPSDFTETDTCIVPPATTGSVAPGANCSITVTFTPTISGFRFGTVTINDTAFGSPQTINLSGFGSAPGFTVVPSSLIFASQGVSTPSPQQNITLSNHGNAPLTINSVSISAGFAQSNTCAASVAAGSTCTITVTFTPTTIGAASGSITINDNATGSPQNIPLSGTGAIAFSISSATTSQTVNRGTDTATFTISAASLFGFSGAINLACSSNAPTNCAFNPTSITAGGPTSTLTVTNITALGANTLNFVVTGTSGSQSSTLNLSMLIPDFTVIVAPTTQTVTAGQATSYTASLTPINNFTQLINLTCTGAPQSVTCTVNPTSVTLNGDRSTTTTAAVTVTTTARPAMSPNPGHRLTPPPLSSLFKSRWFAWLLIFGMVTTMAAAKRRRAHLGFAMTALLVLTWAACSVGTNVSNGTAAGTYTLQIKAATVGTLQHTAGFSVTVP